MTTFLRAVRRPRPFLPFLALLVLGLAGCTGATPSWGGPSLEGETLYVISSTEKLLALNLNARRRGESFPAAGEWQLPADKDRKLGQIYAAPKVAGDSVFVGVYGIPGAAPGMGRVVAADLKTGLPRWQFPSDGAIGGVVSPPGVANGTVYVGSNDYAVYALDAATGQLRWKYATQNKVWASPVVGADGTVYVASLDHRLYALDGRTGEKQWDVATGGALASAPVLAGGLLLFGSADNRFYAVDAGSGSIRWQKELESWAWGTPFVSGDTIYTGTLANQVFALRRDNGQRVWGPQVVGGPVSATPVLVAGVLSVAAQDGKLYGIDPATGAEKWVYVTNPGGPVYTSAASEGGTMIYVKPMGQKLIAVDAASGSPRWVFPTNGWPG